jgi:hypothetical protein
MRPSSALLALIAASLLIGACRSALVPASEGAIGSPPETSSPAPSPVGAPSPSTSTLRPTGSEATKSQTANSFVGGVVVTLADSGLRVRSQPRVSDNSQMLQPLLPAGSLLYVLAGPVSVSGYVWYEVQPLASRKLPGGWVASADRTGEPWIAAADFDCPPVPTTLRSLAALPSGVGLLCFPRVPITFTARVISCSCDMDGSWYTPSWFFLGSGGPNLLVEPGVAAVPRNVADWFVLNLDPAGEHPDVVPVDQTVEVTGVFDHPAASNCARTDMDGEPVASQGCRLEFAVTHMLVFGP